MSTPEPPARPEPAFTLGHRRCLDGLRGLAILLVLLSHIPKLPFGGGFLGVDLFFVLSGFLITSLLLEEWAKTGTLSLTSFYARRSLRLLPALLLMLGTMVGVSAAMDAPAEASAMRRAALMTLLYSANWFKAFRHFPKEDLSPTWSLSVEEQFYILWPLLLLLMLRMKLPRTATAGLVVAALLASAAARAILWSTTRSFERVYFGSDSHADGLLAGCLVALLLFWKGAPRASAATTVLNGLGVGVLFLIGVIVVLGSAADPFFLQVGYLVVNLGMAVLVASLLASPWPALLAFFEWGPLVWLGKISYGLYLWHMAVIWMLSHSPWSGGNGFWPRAMGLTVAAAALSHYLLERPLLRLKRRFERTAPARPVSP